MNEPALGIIPDSALFKGYRGFAQLGGGYPGKAEVKCTGLDVQTVAGNSPAFSPQFLVGFRTAKRGKNFEGLVRVQLSGEQEDLVDDLRVKGVDKVGSVITQQVVDIIKRFLDIVAVLPVDEAREKLPGIDVIQIDGSFRKLGECLPDLGQGLQGEHQHGRCKQPRLENLTAGRHRRSQQVTGVFERILDFHVITALRVIIVPMVGYTNSLSTDR